MKTPRLLVLITAVATLAQIARAQDALRVDHNTRQPTTVVNLSGSNVIGLGGAAGLNVGTTAGTVTGGNDSRFTNTVTPEMYAGGVPIGVSQLEFADAAITAGSATLTSATAGFIPSDAVAGSQKYVVIRGAGAAVAASTATGVLTFTGQPQPGDTFSIGATVYTTVSALTGAANQVLIGANTAATVSNLIAAINGASGAGATYGTGTTANAAATAAAGSGAAIALTSTTAGAGGNSLTITSSAAASFGISAAGVPITSLSGGYPAYTANLDAVVTGYTSPTQVTISATATTSVSGAVLDAWYNDSAAIQAAATALGNTGGGKLLLNPSKWYGLAPGGLLIPYGVEVTNGTNAKEPTQVTAVGSPIEPEALGGGIALLGGAGGGDQAAAYVDFSAPRSALDSMVFFDPDESPNLGVPVAKPFAVRQSVCGTTVSGIELLNTFRGVDVQAARTMTEYVTGNPLLTGVRWDQGYDVPVGHDMHFVDLFVRNTNLAPWFTQNSAGFLAWDNDELELNRLFSYAYRIGIAFQASTESGRGYHGSYGLLTDSNFDGCQFPVLFSCAQSQGMMLTDVGLTTSDVSYNLNAVSGFWATPGSTGLISLSQCPFWGAANTSIRISGGSVRYRDSDIGTSASYNVLIDGPADVDIEDLIYSGQPPGSGTSEMVTSAASAATGRMVRNRFFASTTQMSIVNNAPNLQTSTTDINFIAQAYANPTYTWTALGNGANLKNWYTYNDTNGNFTLGAPNDAFSSVIVPLTVNHTTGVVSLPYGIQVGNTNLGAGLPAYNTSYALTFGGTAAGIVNTYPSGGSGGPNVGLNLQVVNNGVTTTALSLSPTTGLAVAPIAIAITGTTFANRTQSPSPGTFQTFTDSTTNAPGAAITGGGSYTVIGYNNGFGWYVMGGSGAASGSGGTYSFAGPVYSPSAGGTPSSETSAQAAALLGPGSITDAMWAGTVKPAVTVVATSNLTLAGEQTIDGVTTAGSLVLATAQTTGSQNGPWVSGTGAWTRPAWYASGSTTQAPQYSTTLVRLGTAYQGSTWRMTTANVTIDTTATAWVQTPLAAIAQAVVAETTRAEAAEAVKAPATQVLSASGTSVTPLLAANGNLIVNVATLTGATSINAPSGTPADGQRLTFRVNENSTGGYALTFATGTGAYAFPSSNPASSLPTAAGAKYSIVFEYVASDGVWWAEGVANRY